MHDRAPTQTRRSPYKTRRTLSLCFFVLFVSSALNFSRAQEAAPSSASPKLEALLHEAEDALNRHDYAAAIKPLKSAVELQPDLAPAWFSLGYAYTGLHQNDDAIEAYRKTISLDPDLFEAQMNLGILLVETKRPAEASPHLEKAAALKPQNARAHLYYGRALAASGDSAAAEKQFQEAIHVEPALAIAYFDIGQVEQSQKQFELAEAAFEKAATLDPRLTQAQLGWALALEGLSRPAEAASHFEQYLVAQPDDLDTRFHLARLDLQQGKNDAALEDLQKVYQARPETPGLAAALGDVYALLKKFPDSEKFYRQALAATPGEAGLHRALGQTLWEEQKFPEAEAEFRATLKLDPQNRDARVGLASSLYEEKRYGEAIPLLEAQARAPNPPAAVFFVLATCYDNLRVRPKALEAYERYLALSHGENPDQEWQAQQRVKLLRRVLGK